MSAFFFMVPLTFVLTLILPDIFGIVLAPTGLAFALIVFVADCVQKKVFTNVQLIKMFLNSLLLMKFFILCGMPTCVYVTAICSLFLALALVVVISEKYDKLVTEGLKNDGVDRA